MNDYTKKCLYHAWGKSPEEKAKERTYNTGYYQAHREKIIRNVIARRKAKQNENKSYKLTPKDGPIPVIGIDTILETLTRKYDQSIVNRNTRNPGRRAIDYTKSGEAIYDAVHAVINLGKRIINSIRTSQPAKDVKSTYSEGFDWLKKHW